MNQHEVSDLVQSLGSKNIFLYLDAGQLRFKAEKGALNHALKQEIKDNKSAIVAYLQDLSLHAHSPCDQKPLVALNQRDSIPLSYGQKRLWFIDTLLEGSSHYNLHGRLYISEQLNMPALQSAAMEIVRRHQVLRSVFQEEKGEVTATVLEDYELAIPFHDISTEGEDIAKRVNELSLEESSQVFNLASDLMIRFCLLKVASEQHILLYTMHHIASDAWSLGILQKELNHYYRSFANKEICFQPENLPLQYGDFASWQKTVLDTKGSDARLNDYIEFLRAAPKLHELPLSRVRAPKQSYQARVIRSLVDKELSLTAKQHAQNIGMTPFAFLQAIFALLLTKASATQDLLMGTPLASRDREGLESLIGFFVNTLVIRQTYTSATDLKSYLQQAKENIISAFAHKDIPFERFVELLAPERNLSYSPLVQISFSFVSGATSSIVDDDIIALHPPRSMQSDSSIDEIESTHSPYELKLDINDHDDSFTCAWIYNKAIFDEDFIAQMSSGFNTLLAQVCRSLDEDEGKRPLSSLHFLSAEECESLLEREKRHQVYSADVLLHQLFENAVDKSAPPANLIFQDKTVSYSSLDQQANQIAQCLIARGVESEARIVLCMPRSIELLASMLAVLKTGAAYVPVDVHTPSERLTYMVQDSEAYIVLGHSTVRDKLSSLDCNILYIDSELFISEYKNKSHLPVKPLKLIHPNNLAYLIYTSGSTGLPKAVAVSHRNACEFVSSAIEEFFHSDLNAAVVSSTLAFDATVGSLWLALCGGIDTLLLPEGVEALEELRHCIENSSKSYLFKITPSHLKALAAQYRLKHNAASRHVFVIAGEILQSKQIHEWAAILPNSRFINEYGPTEASVGASTYAVDLPKLAEIRSGSVPIGRALGDTQLYTLNDDLQPQAPLCLAELYIAGAGVARAYINQAKKTALHFVPNPFSHVPGERMYRTGDIVRRLADHNLEFIGRRDSQIKLRGYRIEFAEIENQMRQCAQVQDAALALQQFSQQLSSQQDGEDACLVAYIVLKNSEAKTDIEKREDVEAIKKQLANRLPPYMCPQGYVTLHALPLNDNAKIDRKALPVLAREDLLSEDYEPPKSQTEISVCVIWQSVLGKEKIGLQDNFFHLGGHSLLATHLVSRLREDLGIEIPLRCIFESPRVQDFCALVENYSVAQRGAAVSEIKAMTPEQRLGRIPLSYAQQRLWFIDQLDPGSSQYNMPGYFCLQGSLNMQAFTSAVNLIIQRHEILRSTFCAEDGEVWQVVNKHVPIKIPVDDLRQYQPEAKGFELDKLMQSELQQGFDLTSDELLKLRLVILEQDNHLVIYTLHHIAGDGVSKAILQRELAQSYKAFCESESPRLPELGIQYADYAMWQRESDNNDRLQESLSYWRTQLSDLPLVHGLPLDMPRPTRQQHRGYSQQFVLNSELTAKIKDIAQSHQASTFMFMHAAFALLLSRYSGEDDIAVGSAVTGRSHAGLENLIGFFVNDIVVRTRLPRSFNFRDLLDHARSNILDAYTHSQLPFEMLVEDLNPARSMSHSPLFQIKLDERNIAELDSSLGDDGRLINIGTAVQKESLTNEIHKNENLDQTGLEQIVKHDLYFSFAESDGKILVYWLYNKDLFLPETIQSMARAFVCLLDQALSEPDKPLTQLSLLDNADLKEFVASQYARLDHYRAETTFHAEFEKICESKPGNIAVRNQEDEWSYQWLNGRANQLARFILAQSYTPGQRIALCFDRSVELITAMLGCSKSGTSFVLIDSKLPQKRLDKLLETAECTRVLSRSDLMEEIDFPLPAIAIDGEVYERHIERYCKSNLNSPNAEYCKTQVAYVIFTSGSTGEAKAVEISHGALNQYLHFARNRYYQGVDALLMAAHYFDLSLPSVFLPLTHGASIELAPEGLELKYAADFLINTQKPVLLRLTPSHLQGMLHSLQGKSEQAHCFVIGGEALSKTLVKQIGAVFPQADFYNHYGPSETTIGCSISKIQLGDIDSQAGTLPIGRAMTHSQLWVLNEEMQIQSPGVVGELYIGGHALANGYLKAPRETAKKFVCNPFLTSSTQNNLRLYRSGDLVRWTHDYRLEFIGRVDAQTKIRGRRIDLAEIVSALQLLDGVVAAGVDLRSIAQERLPEQTSATNQQMLIAYLVLNEAIDEGVEEETELVQRKHAVIMQYRRSLSELLPDYMVPLVYIFLDALPLNANGKLQKALLPDPEEADLLKSRFTAPETDVQKRLCEMFQQVLNLEQIGIDDDFFLLGGHSLLATQLVNAIRQEYDIEISLRVLFEKPTIRYFSIEVTNQLIDRLAHKNASVLEDEDEVEEVLL